MKDITIRYLKGVGPRREAIFNQMGVQTIKDLLYYFPFRYEDRRKVKKIKELKVGEFSVIKGKVVTTNLKQLPYFIRSKKVKNIFEIILNDDTGNLKCVWFNQAYLADTIKVGRELIIYGKLYLSKKGLQIVSPEYEFAEKGDFSELGKIIGVYRLPYSFKQRFMRKIISLALKQYCSNYPDPLPFYIRKTKNIPNIAKSLEGIHFPTSWQQAQGARERFIFEELFLSQILVYLRKAKHRLQKGIKFRIRKDQIDKIKNNFPFKLTLSQEQVLGQILDDLSKPYPMHRLLQGDVGCGKTAVAIFAIGVCVDSGWQAGLMVPTEVLAYQHKETLEKIFRKISPIGNEGASAIRVITSSLPKKEIQAIHRDLENGNIKIIVGTHSLIQERVRFKKLGLVIIDEQHRFGVAQRALLLKKGRIMPHCLVMSATPIPRSLALSLYGDLDLSVIRDRPKGRKLPQTRWVKEKDRNKVYKFLEEKLKAGRQVYIIYPVIEENEAEDLKSLEIMYDKISERFSNFSIRMFHGRLKSEEKIEIIKAFREKKVDILVSTTVVEVGVDIENATIMVVENPERFGLAQLHQLRGRIQRSVHQPYFILISRDNLTPGALQRLKIISEVYDGFKIAEEDLKLRGPGDFFGNLQHGLPDLKIASPLQDLEILKEARIFAYRVIKSDPYLEKAEHRCLREYLFGSERNDENSGWEI